MKKKALIFGITFDGSYLQNFIKKNILLIKEGHLL